MYLPRDEKIKMKTKKTVYIFFYTQNRETKQNNRVKYSEKHKQKILPTWTRMQVKLLFSANVNQFYCNFSAVFPLPVKCESFFTDAIDL